MAAVGEAALGALLVVDRREDVGVRPQVADLQEDAVRTADAHQEVVDQRGPSCPLLRTHPRRVYGRTPRGVAELRLPSPLLPISAVPARPQALLVLVLLIALVVPSAAFAPERRRRAVLRPVRRRGPAAGAAAGVRQPETPAQPLEQPAETAPTDGSGEEAAVPAQSSDPSLPVTGLPALDAARARRGHAGHRPPRAAPSLSRRSARPGVAAIAVSYSGVLGGAERVLLEVASGLEEPPLIACPPGPLADAARERGIGVLELRERSLELRRSPARARRRAGPARGSDRRAARGSSARCARTRSWRGACAPA